MPEREPGGDVGDELWNERVKGGGGGVCADNFENGEEYMVARCGGWGEDVEDGGQSCDGEGGGMLWGGGDGLL